MSENKEKILIVEDEVLIAFSLKKMLEPFFSSEMANDFDEAKLLLTHKDFDLVLIDITLPGDNTGLDLAKLINEQFSIPFIFTTALTDTETLDKVKSAKPSAYLSKPVERANLITAIDLALANFDFAIKIEIGKQSYYIQSKDFLYAEADHIYVELFLKSGKNQILRTTLSHLEEIFPADRKSVV